MKTEKDIQVDDIDGDKRDHKEPLEDKAAPSYSSGSKAFDSNRAIRSFRAQKGTSYNNKSSLLGGNSS